MKNLIGAAAPAQRIFKCIQFLMLVVLVIFGFTSCKDQSKVNVSPVSELNAKSDFQETEYFMDIRGNQLPPGGYCELDNNFKANEVSYIGGGKDAGGGPGKHNVLSLSFGEISVTEEFAFSLIGGRGGLEPQGGIYSRFYGNDKSKDYEPC